MLDARHGAPDDDNDVLWLLLGVRALTQRVVEARPALLDRAVARARRPHEDHVLLALLGAASLLRTADAVVDAASASGVTSAPPERVRAEPSPPAPSAPRGLLR